jgi:cell division protein FtsB
MTWASFIKSRLTTALLLIVLGFVIFFAARIFVQKKKIDSEISGLIREEDKIKQDNSQLSYLLQYFNSAGFQEKQAREKLNLKKNGEQVIALPSDSNSIDQTQASQASKSNYKLWFDYFFNH